MFPIDPVGKGHFLIDPVGKGHFLDVAGVASAERPLAFALQDLFARAKDAGLDGDSMTGLA